MPVDVAGGLGAIALFAVPGYGVTELMPSLCRLPPPRRAAYGYLLGVAVVAGSLYALSHFGGVPLRRPAIGLAAALPTLAGLAWNLVRRVRARQADRPPSTGSSDPAESAKPSGPADLSEPSGPADSPSPSDPAKSSGASSLTHRMRGAGGWVVAGCAVLGTLICAGVFFEAVSNPVHDWDGRMTWCAQARYVRAAGTVDPAVLTEVRWYVNHPRYPLLLPVAQAAALEAMGAETDAFLPRALYAPFLAALLLLVYDGARRGGGPAIAAVAALALAVAPFVVHGEGGAETAYSDLPLACFYGGGLVLLLAPRRQAGSGLAAGLLLAAAVLTKSEGALLAMLALALAWWWRRRARGWRRVAMAALPVALALVLLISWRAGIPNRFDEDYAELVHTGGFLAQIAARIAAFVPVVAGRMMSFEHWGGFWSMAAALFAAGGAGIWRRTGAGQALSGDRSPYGGRSTHGDRSPQRDRNPRRKERHGRWRSRRLALAAASLGPLAIGVAAYLVYSRPAFLATVTWDRFLLQGSVPTTVLLASALAAIWRRWCAAVGRRWRAAGPVRWRRRGQAPEAPPAESSSYGGKAELSRPPQ
jgi:hypothetical protein